MFTLRLKLIPVQWKMIAGIFSHISQAIILFSMAAFVVPETVNLSQNFPRIISLGFLLFGLFFLAVGIIITKKGK